MAQTENTPHIITRADTDAALARVERATCTVYDANMLRAIVRHYWHIVGGADDDVAVPALGPEA